MRTEERIRAVRRVIDQGEALLDAWAELGDELSAIAEEVADAAYLPTAQDRLTSAKDRVAEALALLRQWLKEAEANDEGEASERGARRQAVLLGSHGGPRLAFRRSHGARSGQPQSLLMAARYDRFFVIGHRGLWLVCLRLLRFLCASLLPFGHR